MATAKQLLGARGEIMVTKKCGCPRCKRKRTLRRLPVNFKCADVICDFCGFLAQVKTMNVVRVDKIPRTCLGAAWRVQRERMKAGIYFPLFLVQVAGRRVSIFYLSADLQRSELFVKRKPLSENARRAGWQGFIYDFGKLPLQAFVRIF